MSVTSSCALCDTPIPPAPAPALCASCSILMEEPEYVHRVRRLEAVPTEELLRRLDEAVHKAVSAAAADALTRLRSERIYGFFLLHYIFSSLNAAVMTESKLGESVRKHQQRRPHEPVSPDHRWTPVDAGHYFYREDLFLPTSDLFMALEKREQETAIARIFIRALRHVRQNIITAPEVVVSVMDYSEGPAVPFYAYAELFNDAPTLARLRADLYPGPHWDYLDLERSRVPAG